MKLKTIAAASAVALTALSSQASTFELGAHDPLEVGGSLVSGSFFDIYKFSLSQASVLISGATTAFGGAPILGGGYTLYSYGSDGLFGTADDVGLGAWTFSVGNVASLAAGNYYYSVSGWANGVSGYNFSSAAAPVPEPETYALLAAGLGIVGFVAARRRRDF
ncbi:MAG: FxDxF family PEP-CTERM protein [Roseateles sp.]